MRLITKTVNIMRFLAGQETEKICAVLAHAEDGKLGYMSCCCLIGSFTADHTLITTGGCPTRSRHYFDAKKLPYAWVAEAEFLRLTREYDDAARRRRIIPLLHYELRRRELQVRGPAAEATRSGLSLKGIAVDAQ